MAHTQTKYAWIYLTSGHLAHDGDFVIVTHDGENTIVKSKSAEDGSDGDDREYTCLIRVTNGKQTTFSTKASENSIANAICWLIRLTVLLISSPGRT